jgi:hypothetical protein
MIRVVLPFHLRTLAAVAGEVQVEVEDPATLGSVLDAIETKFPVLRGAIRDGATLKRRPLVRFFGCKVDISDAPHDFKLPAPIVNGEEPLLIVGAMAGG